MMRLFVIDPPQLSGTKQLPVVFDPKGRRAGQAHMKPIIAVRVGAFIDVLGDRATWLQLHQYHAANARIEGRGISTEDLPADRLHEREDVRGYGADRLDVILAGQIDPRAF